MTPTVEEMARELDCCGIKLCRGAVYADDDTLIGFMCLDCGVGYSLPEIRTVYAKMKGEKCQ